MTIDGVVVQDIGENQQTDIHEDLLRELHPELLTGEILDNPVFDQADNRIYNYGDKYPLCEFPIPINVLQEVHRNSTGQSPKQSNYSLQCHIL